MGFVFRQWLIVLLLFMSSFWPVAHAQGNATNVSVSPGMEVKPNIVPHFCALPDLHHIELTYDQVTGIQGIVTQDVATSAERYKASKAKQELGISEENEASKIADRFGLYFMGPDGVVKYGNIIKDQASPDNGWIFNTTIFGRVEYAGLLGEDPMFCPDLAAKEKGMCNYKAGDEVQDVYSKDWSVGVEWYDQLGKAYFTAVSDFVQFAQTSDTPWGRVDLGQSRVRARSFRISLVLPPGSEMFVVPKTYMYFMSRLKNVAMVDTASQFAFMISGFANMFRAWRGGLRPAKEKALYSAADEHAGAIEEARRVARHGKLSEKDFSALDKLAHAPTNVMGRTAFDDVLDDALRAAERSDDKVGTLKRLFGEDKVSRWIYECGKICKEGKLDLVDFVRTNKRSVFTQMDANDWQRLATSTEVKPEALDKLLRADPAGFAEKHSDNVVNYLVQEEQWTILPKLPGSGKKEIVEALAAGDINEFKEATKLKISPDDFERIRSGMIRNFAERSDVVGDIFSDAAHTQLAEKSAAMQLQGLLDARRAAKPEEVEAIDKEIVNFLRSSEGERLLAANERYALAMRDAATRSEGLAAKLGLVAPEDHLVKESWDTLVRNSIKSPTSRWSEILGFGRVGAPIRDVLRIRAAGLAGTLIRSYLRGLYYVGRPIIGLAYGLQSWTTIIAMKGYLELSAPGITIEWNPDTTGNLFTKQTYVIAKGVSSSMPGMYSAGILGPVGSKEMAGFLISMGIDPALAGKYSQLGNYLIFGYDADTRAYQKILKIQSERPRGITQVEKAKGGYMLRMRNWENAGITILEDPTAMKPIGNNQLITSAALQTSNVDIYGYIYGNPDQIKEVFPITWTLSEKLRDWGFLTNAVTTASILYMFPRIPRARAAIGATLVSAGTRGAFGAGRDLMVSKATDMKSLENCVATGKCKRPSCEEVEARCEAEVGAASAWLMASGVAQTALDVSTGGLAGLISFGLGMTDMLVLEGGIPGTSTKKITEGKMERTDRCLKELLTCNERNFVILGGSKVKDPSLIKQEQEEARKIKGVPGLDSLPIEDFLKGFENISGEVVQMDQEQLNIHAEADKATGRLALRNIFYFHLLDTTVDWLGSKMGITLCGLNDNGTLQQCVEVKGKTLKYGNFTMDSGLVPFKWMDTEMPALIIPNEALSLNLSEGSCAVFSVAGDGSGIHFNSKIISGFSDLGFEELERTFGNLRVINTDEGSIYPSPDVEGNIKLELDSKDGSYDETNETVFLDQSGKVHFYSLRDEREKTLGFRSAVFSGGTVVKVGNSIYILPRYFKPAMSGLKWREITKGNPLVSDTGQPLEAVDKLGNLIGINAKNTRIPGKEKLGIITAMSAEKDINGDGKITDNEKSGWRFYKVGNKTYFDLYYNGKKETYDADQVEVDEKTGKIKVYEKDKPHTDAYLIRAIETKVDELGRTLMTIKDKQGNALVEDALVKWIKGTGGSINYNPDTNNYVFVNGQPIELNNEFKTNGFNAVTGTPDPPILQPSARHGTKPWEEKPKAPTPPMVPTVDETSLPYYLLAILLGLVFIRIYQNRAKPKKESQRGEPKRV